MGADYSELWFKAPDQAAAEAVLAADLYEVGQAGIFLKLHEDRFPAELLDGDERPFALAEELAPYGEVVMLGLYDGPAGELCGSFFYLHLNQGQVLRKLVFGPQMPDGWPLRWLCVEGQEEAWEAALIAHEMEKSIARWLERQQDNGIELPDSEKLNQLKASWAHFQQGQEMPEISEYTLTHAVFKAILEPTH